VCEQPAEGRAPILDHRGVGVLCEDEEQADREERAGLSRLRHVLVRRPAALEAEGLSRAPFALDEATARWTRMTCSRSINVWDHRPPKG
jgi:hypothetical protein